MNVKIFYVQFQDLIHQCHMIFFDIKLNDELIFVKTLIFTNVYLGKYLSNLLIHNIMKNKILYHKKLKWQILKMTLDIKRINNFERDMLANIFILDKLYSLHINSKLRQ